MNIKTLSQIKPIGEKIHLSSYVGFSQYSPVDGGKYSSRKVTYGEL